MVTARFRILAITVTVGLAALLVSTAGSRGVGTTLEQVVLKAEQVGPGYVVRVIPGGRAVRGQVTLDMCGFRFASENLRTGRLQTAYFHPGSKLSVSNEVVSYRPGGAAFAMREIEQAIRTCPHRPVPSTVRGVPPLTYRIVVLPTANMKLLPGAIVFKAAVVGSLNGKRISRTSLISYQRERDVLSGVYVDNGSLQARTTMVFAASAQSARNLRRQH